MTEIEEAALNAAPTARPARRFADVCAMLPAAPPLADALAGPAWAAIWADAIVAFWETERELGALDANEPLYLLDVSPGCGSQAWLLIDALAERLPSSRVAEFEWRYVVCEAGAGLQGERELSASRATSVSRHRVLSHPRFAPLIDSGRVGLANWQLSGEGFLLGHTDSDSDSIPIERFANPVAAIATGWFSRQPADLYGAHYGQWLEATVEVTADASGYALAYQWQPASMNEPADVSASASAAASAGASTNEWAPLVERYTTNLVSACVLLPTGAMTLVNALRRISGERYLLLACDAGAAGETALRDGASSAPDTWQPGDTLSPVNFHALAWRQRCACVIQRETGAEGLVLQAVWSRAGEALPSSAQRALTGLIERCEPWDARRLAQAAGSSGEGAPLDTSMTLLRASNDDPAVLGAVLSNWSARAADLSAAPERIRQAWRDALARTWRHYLPGTHTTQFDAQLASAATTLGAWGLAKDIWRSVLAFDETMRLDAITNAITNAITSAITSAIDAHRQDEACDACEQRATALQAVVQDDDGTGETGETGETNDLARQHHARWRACVHLHLANCLASSGALDEARTHIAHALALEPDDPDVHAWQEELNARATRREALPWYRPDLARDAALSIEPLGLEHADALLDAYADPHITEFANLPTLSDLEQVRAWLINDAAEAGRTSYAVIDSQRGLVGVVSLCRAGDAAHFYFWIDARAQGQGFGTRAARLLFEQARAAGIDEMFTASYAANARSHEALRRLGFHCLPVRSVEDADVRFFHRRLVPANGDAEHAAIENTVARFSALSAAIDSPVELVLQTRESVGAMAGT
nr:hypothetical protein HUO10_006224 [Paraburkholderia busanensis]